MGGKTSTSTQAVSVPSQVLAQYQSVNDKATATANQPFQDYSGQFVAPVNQQQTTGINATNTAANEAQPYYGAATGVLGNAQAGTAPVNNSALGLAGASASAVNPSDLDASSIQKYMSPYLSNVLGSTSALLNQNNQQQQAGQLGTAITSGAFGGDRAGIAAANLEQQQNLSNANIYSGIANTGYNNALGVAQNQQGVQLGAQQANRTALGNAATNIAGIGQTAYGEGANTASELGALGSGAQTAGLQGASAQIGAGTVQQQTQQAQDTAEYNQFLQQQSYPFQVDQFLANIAEGTGSLSGSTTTTQQPGGFFSDERLKTDIKPVGKTFDGQDIVSYKMHGDPRTRMGLIAQDVEKKHPEAVGLAAGYKIVDYGKATEKAANRGHFYEGGVVNMRPRMAAGGDPYDIQDILRAQQAMYTPQDHKREIPDQGGGGSHQLAVANGAPAAPASGSNNVSQGLGLVMKGQKAYKQFTKPSTTTTTTPGGLSPDAAAAEGPPAPTGLSPEAAAAEGPAAPTAASDTAGLGAADAAAPAAADAAATAAPAAAEAAAPVAADAAATAAGTAAAGAVGGAAVDAGAETAAAIAAEYAASIAAAAVVAAKRGGRIHRKGLAAGGTPYRGDGDGSPYAAADGVLVIPDTENSNQVMKAGALQKQPTGLQTAMKLGSQEGASDAVGSIFSNEALARGGLVRRGYDDGGDVDTDIPDAPDPGLGAATAAADEGPPREAAKKSLWDHVKDSGVTKKENLIPLLTGLAAMGTAPTRSWGTALAAGLGAGARSYVPTQEGLANAEQTRQTARGIEYKSDIGKAARDYALPYLDGSAQAGASSTAPAQQPLGPTPLDSKDAVGYYQKQYLRSPIMTGKEKADIEAGRVGDWALNAGDTFKNNASLEYSQRTDSQQFANQTGAQRRYDRMLQVSKSGSPYAGLKQVDPGLADQVARKAGADPSNQDQWTPQQSAMVDRTAADTAGQHAAIVHQYTGNDFKSEDGAVYDARTHTTPPAPAAQVVGQPKKADLYHEAVQLIEVPNSDGSVSKVPLWKLSGAGGPADYVNKASTVGMGQAAGPSAGSVAAPNALPRTAAPPSPGAAAAPTVGSGSTALPTRPGQTPPTLPGADVTAFPKISSAPVRSLTSPSIDSKGSLDNVVDARNQGYKDAKEDVALAARSNAILTPFQRKLNEVNPRDVGPGSPIYESFLKLKTAVTGNAPGDLVDMGVLDKFANQLGVQNVKSMLKGERITNQEMMSFMNRASASVTQPVDVMKAIISLQKANNDYDLLHGNTKIQALQHGATPLGLDGAIETASPREKFVSAAMERDLGKGPAAVTSKAQYDALPKGATYTYNGKTGVKQ